MLGRITWFIQKVTICGCRYLGLYTKEIDAAQAYDRESVMRKGLKAITNFDISEYLSLLSEI